MKDASKAVGAPTLAEIAGKTHEFYPLRFRDWGHLEQYLKDRVVALGRKAMEDTALANDKDRIMRLAYEHTDGVSMSRPGSTRLPMSSPDAILQTIWLSARHGDPSLTLDDAEDLCEACGDVAELIGDIMRISGQSAKKKGAQTEGASAPPPGTETGNPPATERAEATAPAS